MAFDIVKTNIAELAETGYEFAIKLPDGTPTDFLVTVRGHHSPAVKAHSKRTFNQMQLKEQQAKRKGKDFDLSLDDAEDMAVESAVMRLVTWKGLEEDGKEIKFSQESAKRIMRELDWVRAQVLEESEIAANFI